MLSIYRASAGSGKTHTLTQFYLRLAFEHPFKFREILAVTFTNKAASEMKSRIVEALAHLAKRGAQAEHFAELSLALHGATPEQLQAQARLTLSAILHHYSDFAIGTIDSFVQKVLRAFAFEIGVHAGYAIEFDTGRVSDELTSMLYQQLHTDPKLLHWLVDFANYKIEDGSGWDFRRDLRRFASEIFKESFQRVELPPQAELTERLDALNRQLRQQKKEFETQLVRFSEQTQALIDQHGLQLPDSRNMQSIVGYLLRKIRPPFAVKDLILSEKLVLAIDHPTEWARKTDKMTVIEPIYRTLAPVLGQVHAFVGQHLSQYILADNLLRNFHNLGIAFELARLLPQYREDNNLLLISDSNQLLREIVQANDAPFIYEKIGNTYKNILIDEFQDTSTFQWDNFRPLLLNAQAEGHHGLIVGDIKQSIYRWRGGDWNLLLHRAKAELRDTQEFALTTNYRSRPNIVRFNNHIFEKMVAVLAAHKMPDHGQSPTRTALRTDFVQAYADVAQEVAPHKAGHPGHLELRFVPPGQHSSPGKALRERLATELPQTIEALLRSGVQPRDIAILTRRNGEGKTAVDILHHYMQHTPDAMQYPILSNEALLLANAPSIQTILAALRVLHHQADTLAWALLSKHCQVAPAGQVFQFLLASGGLRSEMPIRQRVRGYVPDAFLDEYDALQTLGLQELSARLQSLFGLQHNAAHWAYLQAFEDMLIDFAQQKATDIGSFLEWWDQTGHTSTLLLSEQQNAVRITTIHKSKGLAYKVVLIPFCDWRYENSHAETLLWVKSEVDPLAQLPAIPFRYAAELDHSPLADTYFQEYVYKIFEATNMLYVAFTRPRDALYIWAPLRKEPDKEPTSVADALYLAWQQCKAELGPSGTDDPLHLVLPGHYPPSAAADSQGQLRLHQFPLTAWRNKLSLQRQSAEFFVRSRPEVAERINYGNLMHELLSRIEHPGQIDAVLDQMHWAGRLGRDERSQLQQTLAQWLDRPNMRQWFDPRWTVFAEKAIIRRDGHTRIPDRVLMQGNELVIIDFKFGEQRPEYIDQVLEYKNLLHEIEPNKHIEAIVYYVPTDTLVRA